MDPPPKPANVALAEDGLPKEIVEQALAAASGNMDDALSAGSSKQNEQHDSQVKEIREAGVATTHADLETADVTDVPPPAFGQSYSELDLDQNGLNTVASVADDGRVNINIKQRSRRLSNLLVPALRSQLDLQLQPDETPQEPPPGYLPPSLTGEPGKPRPPPLNIVIQVVGSRGDVQPFVALGLTLKNTYGHRVRLATHPTFKQFVEENELEFFSIGGDPAELMAFMVKNPGLMPGFETLRSGDVGKRRKAMYEMFKGCWRSCYEAGDGMGIQPSDDYAEDYSSFDSGISVNSNSTTRPFVADVIIANPPSFAHIHCAEKMGVPLHLMFTMPWSPTQAFPHPLANIQSSNADPSLTNFISYALVEMLTWQGLGDVINRFRENSLRLEPVSVMWAPGMVTRLRIPHTYCWSPALIAKPKDWGSHISVSGFYFLSLASTYTPAPDLAAFLDAGPPPVYIGFGSIVVDDPNAMTTMIFEAVKKAGVRALVSKGWGGLGADELGVPPGVFMLGNVPHDWLFKLVSCVVHHGGAGTTAAGIATGKPTVVVPFFGDQPFWGAMVAKAGAGPLPIPYKNLTSDNLAAAILEALQPSALERASELGSKIAREQGTDVGATSFHDKLDFDTLRCSLAPSHAAVWRVKRTNIRLSALSATVLGNEGLLSFNDLKLYRPCEYDTEDGPWDPITGGASALLGTIGSLMMGVADFPVEIVKALKPKSSDEHDGTNTPSAASPLPFVPSSKAGSLLEHYPSAGSRSSISLRSGAEDGQDTTTTPTGEEAATTHEEVQRASSLGVISSNGPADRASPTPSGTAAGTVRSSMAQVMSGKLSRSNSGSRLSRSPSRHRRHDSDCSAGPAAQATIEAAIGAGKSVSRIVGAGLKSPMDFTLGLARGFHNAPRLYGDTVRPAERVTGLQSGLVAAGKEFGYGFYDGISGLVTQPLKGAKDEGVAGLVKGIGKGLGGVVLKPGAAVWGLPGYTFKGVYKELQKHFGSSVQSYIIAARTAQGYEDWKTSTEEERLDIIHRWNFIQTERKSSKKGHMTLEERIREGEEKFAERRKKSSDHMKQQAGENKPKRKGTFKKDLHDFFANTGIRHAQTSSALSPAPNKETEDIQFEEAIRASVKATSRGDQAEDRLIERAIRASVSELQSARDAQLTEQEALNRAIRASVFEANRGIKERETPSEQDTLTGRRFIDSASLQQSLQHSLEEYNFPDGPAMTVGPADSAVDTDDDDIVREVTKMSRSEARPSATAHEIPTSEEDDDLKKAIEESEILHKQHTEEIERAKMEEQIVLNYIKKQSLQEENRRLKQSGTSS